MADSDFQTLLAAHRSGRSTAQPARMGSDTATPMRECGNCKSGNCSPGTTRWKPYRRRWGISGRKSLRLICDEKNGVLHFPVYSLSSRCRRDLGALYHRILRRSHLTFLGMTHEVAAHSENSLNQWVSDTLKQVIQAH